ncbi:hypothetical protein V493_07741 [Pseudogymnoascus sp. VKM F-4281 (FW-2241)]|nr:hypothetical protein V493_07741 [Pseudogymnoascus sp. VKM F-4281 (FW-2241)]
MHPPLPHPIRHQRHNRQRGRDGRALKVCRLARRVLGHVGDCDVEAREACEAAEHEEGEDEVVGGGAEADCEGGGGGGDAEGYLFREWQLAYCSVILSRFVLYFLFTSHHRGDGKTTYQVSERIEFLPHQAALPTPPRDLPIEEIKEQPQRHKRQRSP